MRDVNFQKSNWIKAFLEVSRDKERIQYTQLVENKIVVFVIDLKFASLQIAALRTTKELIKIVYIH